MIQAVYENQVVVRGGKRPFLIELVGPAGAGKTTLLRMLSQQSNVQAGIPLAKGQQLFAYLHHLSTWLPTHLRHYRHSRWFNQAELRSMVYLKSWQQALPALAGAEDQAILLDHGPIFRLARLHRFGPPVTRSKRYQQWWQAACRQWSKMLHSVVWLDASNEVLGERIQQRRQNHVLKGKTAAEIQQYLDRYRLTYAQIIAEASVEYKLRLLQFDTETTSPEQIASEVLTRLSL